MQANLAPTPLQLTESFVVRRWRVGEDDWRYALRRIPDGAWLGFASAADLLDFLSRAASASNDRTLTPEDY